VTIPATWKTHNLGELAEYVNGRAFKPEDWADAGLPIVRIQNLNDPTKPFNYYSGTFAEKHKIDSGDVLLSWSGTPGTSFGCFIWERGEALLNQHIFKVKVNKDLVLREYFVHATNSRLDEMIDLAHGAAGLRHVTKAKLETIELPVPPIEAQRRIVARIKECMERVEEIEELKDASRIQQQYLSASLIESELHPGRTGDKGWMARTVGQLVTTVRNGRSIAQDTEGQANGAVLTLTAVRSIDLGIRFQKPIELPDSVARQFGIDAGDVFVSRANTIELVGLSAVAMEASADRLIYPDLLIKLKVNPSLILPRYLAYALRSASSRKQIKDRALGSSQTMVKISGERLREVSIPLPSLIEQEKIVSRLDAAHDLMRQLATESLPAEVAVLRGAILRKAFSGEL
jgi:type I restriction enzyme, S subunit